MPRNLYDEGLASRPGETNGAEPNAGQPQDATQDDGRPPSEDRPQADPPPASESGKQQTNGRIIEWVSLDDIEDDVPRWAWEYGDEGRIQNATLVLFAGRPGSGKSTAARYFVAGYTTGLIDGCYFGLPVNCAYIAAEESHKYVLKPSLRAANADMKRVVTPKVKLASGQYVSILAEDDEAALTAELVKREVRVIVVDPIMDTFKSAVDLYRSNELRPALAPWVRIAEAIDGIVIAIVHFVKGTTGDIVASINGGSAFGEVARCIFGFAKDSEPDSDLRVMTQAKNSCGIEGLSLEYTIEREDVTVSTGKSAKVGRFKLGSESDVSVAEIITPRTSKRPLKAPMQRLLDYVLKQGDAGATPLQAAQHGFAATNKVAAVMLGRLHRRGDLDNPVYGWYVAPGVKAPGETEDAAAEGDAGQAT